MRDSSDSKPKTNDTSRDAISPDAGKATAKPPKTDSESLLIGNCTSVYVYGWTGDEANNIDNKCLLNTTSDTGGSTLKLTPAEARVLAAMLLASADLAEGGNYDAIAWHTRLEADNREPAA